MRIEQGLREDRELTGVSCLAEAANGFLAYRGHRVEDGGGGQRGDRLRVIGRGELRHGPETSLRVGVHHHGKCQRRHAS